ncbi:endolytic transglycosylase MltG [Prevotella sp. KH2C16]|uniref:endolytic transglycosylase MltG n=1 Tax=Prevotella sp. KH2C16 TaxID=1855325 RepID=UPI0008EF81EB|nr:endolytic transglycosylase MltG [Prevotella sp. KH2C16]SFF94010.1 UPF0755 protein [Prevotella sp. KH2C16]
MKKNQKKKYLIPATVCLFIIAGLVYYYFFSAISTKPDTQYIYVDADDNIDSVYNHLESVASAHGMRAFRILSRHSQYEDHIRTGRYEVSTSTGAFQLFRHMKNGMQKPVNLTIPSVRTMDKLAAELSKRLMLDSTTLYKAFTDDTLLQRLGYTKETIPALFIPNTYDIYWNISLEKFLERMQNENRKFWDDGRTAKAKQLKLSPVEVITLASIVDEETTNDSEKPKVAGMYYNRLNFRDQEYPQGMPLQADPTIKFALGDFELRRIYHNMLTINSPYNTYKNTGLPPGPIRIPTVAGIDAVLNLEHHNYLYMCAKEDFSGTHNFARTYQEHLQNAARYSKALNNRGIK